MRYRLNPCHFLCNQDLWQLLKVHKITTMVNLTVTHNFPTIDCSWGVGWSAEFPEFPDQEAEGGVLLAGSQTGRADGKQQVSIFSLSFFHHIFSFPQLCFHLLSVSSWTQSVFLQLFIYLLSCLFCLSVGHPCHHFTKHHLSRLFGQSMSTYYILLPSLTCFLVNLMLE